MRIFVTGASGTIGKAVTKELLSHGHRVLGLVRADDGAAELQSLGAEVQRGTLTDLDVLKKAASECEGVAHLAFVHDFVDFEGYGRCCDIDRAAIEAIGSGLEAAGGDRAFVISSGTMLLAKGKLGVETQEYDATDPFGALRGPSELVALKFAEKGVRVSVMRLPTVYGEGGLGFVTLMLAAIQSKGFVPYLGDGENRWPATHTLDVAQAYRLALESGKVGSVYHPVAEEGVRTKDIAELLARKFGIPAATVSQTEVLETFGPMAVAMGADNPSSSAKTRAQLGWTPVQPSLLQDLDSGSCLACQTALPSWSHRA